MQALRQCAQAALAAPSIFNTQPWRWQISGEVLRLRTDRDRQLLVADPDGRLLTVSCGVALHHARVALAATGHVPRVERLPDSDDPDLLAEVTVVGTTEPEDGDIRLRDAIPLRRTDRRVFTNGIPVEATTTLIHAAEAQHAHMHVVGRDDISVLARVAAQAGALQWADPAYRRELIAWTHRPQWSGDGVPTAAGVEPLPRAVPVRDPAPLTERPMPTGLPSDAGARYAVVFTDEDTPLAWLLAGEALSAVLLTATSLGLATAPMSDVTELAVTREELRRLLADVGVPQLVVRIGHAPPGTPPVAPRRIASDVIYP